MQDQYKITKAFCKKHNLPYIKEVADSFKLNPLEKDNIETAMRNFYELDVKIYNKYCKSGNNFKNVKRQFYDDEGIFKDDAVSKIIKLCK